MMTTIQRDAIARAQRGDFELADAMELACKERMTFFLPGSGIYSLLFGIWEGGRMRRLAYGYASDDGDDDDDTHVTESVRVVVDLNGVVLTQSEDGNDLDDTVWSSVERTPLWALGVLKAYRESLPAPTQAPLIPETV